MGRFEDRVNPTEVITVTAIGDLVEDSLSPVTLRFTRTETATDTTATFTLGGSASGMDYYAMSMNAFFPMGVATVDVSVYAMDDWSVEGTETITFSLDNNIDYTVGSPSSGTFNLYDDDTVQVSVAKQGSDPTEGGNGTFRITRSGSTSGNLTVNFSTGGSATSGTDYTSIGASATITSGNSYDDVTVTTLADNDIEGDEDVSITLADGGSSYTAYGSSATNSLTITDDAPVISVVRNADGTECGGNGTFRVSCSGGDITEAMTVYYSSSGTAMSTSTRTTRP